MAKKLYDVLIAEIENSLSGIKYELLSIEQGAKKYEDGKQEIFTRVEVEIPRGNGALSRCRFSCKLPAIQLNVSEEEIESGIWVILSGLKVTYISAQKEIFTRADSLQIA
ncbi:MULTISPECIES: hypothetical protein [Blautia]|uniref:hypothetical protein n=1 Tax=Blautia TaxID=572511 RepID=UPI0029420D72|nr:MULTISPECIES: hypothetical protein [Blautia]MEE0812137.1 hypothetical protein [Blautia sp.]